MSSRSGTTSEECNNLNSEELLHSTKWENLSGPELNERPRTASVLGAVEMMVQLKSAVINGGGALIGGK
jgi:hypothetical protein